MGRRAHSAACSSVQIVDHSFSFNFVSESENGACHLDSQDVTRRVVEVSPDIKAVVLDVYNIVQNSCGYPGLQSCNELLLAVNHAEHLPACLAIETDSSEATLVGRVPRLLLGAEGHCLGA